MLLNIKRLSLATPTYYEGSNDIDMYYDAVDRSRTDSSTFSESVIIHCIKESHKSGQNQMVFDDMPLPEN